MCLMCMIIHLAYAILMDLIAFTEVMAYVREICNWTMKIIGRKGGQSALGKDGGIVYESWV